MPSFSSLAVLSIFALGSLARPAPEASHKEFERRHDHCLSKGEAQQVADNYAQLIRSYTTDLANAALSVDFTDYSESVNTLINECPQGSAAVTLPLLSPSFSSRAQFEVGQGQQAPINFQQLGIWHGCDSVTIRWETTNTANITNVRPVVGLITMETCKAPAGSQYPYLIDTVYSEFDAGAWLENLMDAGICAAASAGNSTAAPKTPLLRN